MSRADRYRRGQFALQALADSLTGVPDQMFRLRQLNQQARADFEKRQQDQAIARERLNLDLRRIQSNEDLNRERNRILEDRNKTEEANLKAYRDSVIKNQEDANKNRSFNIAVAGAGDDKGVLASVYDKFKYPEIAAKLRDAAVNETATETLVRGYFENTDPKDRLIAGKKALSQLKTTNPNYSAIATGIKKDLSDFNAMNMGFVKDPVFGPMYQKLVNQFNLPNSDGKAFIDGVQNIQSMYNKREGLSVDTITPPAGTTAPPAGATSQDSANDLLSENAFNPDGSMTVSPEEFERIQQSGAFDDAQPLEITTQNVLSGIAEGRITQPEIPENQKGPQEFFYEGEKLTQARWRDLLSQRIQTGLDKGNMVTRINPKLRWMDDYAKRITGRDNVDATFLGSKAGRKFLPVE